MCTRIYLVDGGWGQFGDWEDDGNCVPTEQNDEICGPQSGMQKQKRTCEDGTHDKCTAANKEREIDCATGETKKVGHYSVENMEERCGGKNMLVELSALLRA